MRFDQQRSESITYRRVSWMRRRPGGVASSFEELENYSIFSGGSLEFSSSSDLGSSGSLSFSGPALPETHDLLRVYYNFTDVNGEAASYVLGTWFPILSDPVHDMGAVEGSVSLQSVLRVLARAKTWGWHVAPRFSDPLLLATEIVEGFGIPTNRPASPARLSRSISWEPGTPWLEIVNGLLAAAGYAKCRPDAMGGVVMAPTTDPTERDPAWTFSDGDLSIMSPKVKFDRDSADTPNEVVLRHEFEGKTIWAAAINEDPSSPSSTVSKGYPDTVNEQVTDVPGESVSEKAANLKAMASERLVSETAGTEYVEWEHPWVPLNVGDAAGINYRKASILWKGTVDSMKLDISERLAVTSRAKRAVDNGFKPRVEGGWW